MKHRFHWGVVLGGYGWFGQHTSNDEQCGLEPPKTVTLSNLLETEDGSLSSARNQWLIALSSFRQVTLVKKFSLDQCKINLFCIDFLLRSFQRSFRLWKLVDAVPLICNNWLRIGLSILLRRGVDAMSYVTLSSTVLCVGS